jgi:hypothetical protein
VEEAVTHEEYGVGHARFYRRYHVLFWTTQTLTLVSVAFAIVGWAAPSLGTFALGSVTFFVWRRCHRRWLTFTEGYLAELRAEHRRLAEETDELVASLGGKELH